MLLVVRDIRVPARLIFDPEARLLVLAEALAAHEEARAIRYAARQPNLAWAEAADEDGRVIGWFRLHPDTRFREARVCPAGLPRRLLRLYLPAADQTFYPVLGADSLEALAAWVEAFTEYPVRIAARSALPPSQLIEEFGGRRLETCGYERPPLAFALPAPALEQVLLRLAA